MKNVTVNRKYKSTVFAMLFHDKKNLLALYNAVNHSHYTDPEELQVITLDGAVYLGMKNDLAFIIDMHMHLYEHQSTFNPNMPLRNLIYVAKEYEKILVNRSIYSSKLLRIPAPRFLVFYNGTASRPEKETLLLSDAYQTKDENPELELKVTVLNINRGNNEQLLADCKVLDEYMQFVNQVRYHVKKDGSDLDTAVKNAVDECIGNNVLADFLRTNKAEAISMSILEYDEEEREKARRQEREYGIEEGRAALLKELVQKKLAKGKTAEVIAEELEEDLGKIEEIIRLG